MASADLQDSSTLPHQIHVFGNADEVARTAAQMILDTVSAKPASVLGLATGATSLGVYDHLVEAYEQRRASFSKVTSFNLDEYVGLPGESLNSYWNEMRRNFFDRVDISLENCRIPDGNAADPEQEAARYERMIESAGGIDCQLLGIGTNGHIGFNEPGSTASDRTRRVTLAQSTLEANKAFFPFGHPLPTHAITMGVGTILEAKQIILIATGHAKAQAIASAFTGPVGPDCPASFLRGHARVTVLLDRQAAAFLE